VESSASLAAQATGSMTVGENQNCRVGIDLATVPDVADTLDRHGDRYLDRFFTPHEVACCRTEWGLSAASLAARWAAKEATIKVLRPEGRSPGWRSIEVRRQPGGACELQLSGVAAELAVGAGITSLSLSMTHEGLYAAAIVLAVCGHPAVATDPRPAPGRAAQKGTTHVGTH
jgi:holo-[acyl-carrier protein] synthase